MRNEVYRNYFKKGQGGFDSRFEGNVAEELEQQKMNGSIKDYDKQVTIEIRSPFDNFLIARHKVDFRVHHNDGSYELIEAKGVETMDYIIRRNLLEHLWLPRHLDYTYTVIKQSKWRQNNKNKGMS